MKTCSECKGMGTLKVQYRVLTDKDWKDLPPSFLDCIRCNGTGQMTLEKEQALVDYNDAWCKCEKPGEYIYYQHGHSHGYTCSICGKVLQTGEKGVTR
jgi:hypothetical protein